MSIELCFIKYPLRFHTLLTFESEVITGLTGMLFILYMIFAHFNIAYETSNKPFRAKGILFLLRNEYMTILLMYLRFKKTS